MNKYKIILLVLRFANAVLKYKMDDTANTIDNAIAYELDKIILDIEATIKGEV